MKKTYLPLIAMGAAAILMAGCFGNKDATNSDATSGAVVTTNDPAALGSEVSVQYVGRLAGGEEVSLDDMLADCEAYEVFDTSREDLAMACGLYVEQRDYSAPLAFVAGMKQLIPGFEDSVIGHKVGDTYTITISAADAYGEWSEENIVEVPVEQLPPKMSETDSGATVDYVVGDEIATPFGAIKVVAVEDGVVSVDANHPLAGKDLIFDIEIVSVIAPTAESIQAIEAANTAMEQAAMEVVEAEAAASTGSDVE
ncbi:MAG: FKBP-type peptidyl-prolyl cis-trans isomerase [Candidatus Peribacteria bacterium]|nr:MAG: FKBP-type peptidyl-prolyl cis-trans isomerase [Candidatus Peribacteria bacterium]